MGIILRKLCIAAATATVVAGAAIGTSLPANAQHHHHGHGSGGFGAAFIGGLALGAATAPYYYGGPYDYDYGPYAYEPDCYIRRQVFINRWGHRVVRHVRVCD